MGQMESATRSARNILTGLHEVMASRNHAQGKLNHVVNIIGEALSSEVCSIYLLRDGALELFATRGLNEAALPEIPPRQSPPPCAVSSTAVVPPPPKP